MGDFIEIILDGLPTGKTSFIRNLKGEPFNQRYNPTDGGAVFYLLKNEENKQLNIILYDTPGQSTINRQWENKIYNETHCAIFFFQKSNTPSFEYVKKQLKKYKRMKKLAGKETICVLYAIETNERSKISEEEIMRLTRPNVKYMEGSNKINGSAKNVLLVTLKSLYETLRQKDRSPQLDEALVDIFSEKGIRDLVGLYDQNFEDYPYWNKLKAFFSSSNSFHFRTKQSRRKRSVKKQSRRKKSVKKQSRRKKSVKKQSRRKRSVKKQSRRKVN
jgi:GTPase SAR1 family protein